MGGKVIDLVSADRRLIARVLPALAHLQIASPGAADLSIATVLAASSEDDPFEVPDVLRRAEETRASPTTERSLCLFRGGGISMSYLRDASGRILDLVLLDPGRALAVVWLRRSEAEWPLAAPCRDLFGVLFPAWGLHLLHASATALPERGAALFAGRAGAGKSTCALSCLTEGQVCVGDDSVLVGVESGPIVASLYNSARVPEGHAGQQRFLSAAGVVARRRERAKDLVFLSEAAGTVLLPGPDPYPLRVILAPKVTGRRDVTVHPIDASTMLRTIVSATLYHVPGFDAGSLEVLSRLVRSVPCYKLELGSMEAVPEVVSRLIEGHA